MPIITHYAKLTLLQEGILRQISKGIQSKSDITKKLGKNYADVHEAVKILEDKELIKQKGGRQGRGLQAKFYVLTDKGINKIISLKIHLEDFWKMVFFVFDQDNGHELDNLTIDEVFSIYQKDVLQYPRDFVTPLFDLIPAVIESLKKDEHIYEVAIRILILLSENRSLTSSNIVNKLKEENRFSYPEKRVESITKGLTDFLIIEKNEKNSKYSLTHFGVLVFFIEAYDKFLKTKNTNLELLKRVRNTVKNYGELFPTIFHNWTLLSKIFDEIKLASIFMTMVKGEKTFFGLPLQSGGLQEIFYALRAMRDVFGSKMKEEFSVAKSVFQEWLISKGWGKLEPEFLLDEFRAGYVLLGGKNTHESFLGKIIDKILELQVFSILDTSKDNTTSVGKLFVAYRLALSQENLETMVAFLFYTVLLSWSRFQVNIYSDVSLHGIDPSAYREDMKKLTTSCDMFLKQNPDLVKWYNSRMNEIVKFENRNCELMLQLGKFSLDSSEQRKRLDIDLFERLSAMKAGARSH